MKTLKQQLEERIPTIEAAYKAAGRERIDFSIFPEDIREHEEACYDMKIVFEAARKIEKEFDPAEINWRDWSQRKWTPWFNIKKSSSSGFVFYHTICYCSNVIAGNESRLYTLTEVASDYIGKTFIETWEKVQLG